MFSLSMRPLGFEPRVYGLKDRCINRFARAAWYFYNILRREIIRGFVENYGINDNIKFCYH